MLYVVWIFEKISKYTLAQVFSCEFCVISKNTFSYRTPLGAASDLRGGGGGGVNNSYNVTIVTMITLNQCVGNSQVASYFYWHRTDLLITEHW